MNVHEIISRWAHLRWEAAGCPSGRDLEFWLSAEDDYLFTLGVDRLSLTPKDEALEGCVMTQKPYYSGLGIMDSRRTLLYDFI